MRRMVAVASLAVVLAIVPSISGPSTAVAQGSTPGAKTVAFRLAMRVLWEDHITWTRLYLVSAIAGLPDTQPTAQRLLRNQTDIGNAVKPFYGEAAGAKLTALLRDHILIAADLVGAAKAGDDAKTAAARRRWYANADEIADFLSSANPRHWPKAEMRSMMREHLDLTLAEATARLKSDWALDISTYDKIHRQILGMADMLSAGIIAQFPAKFR
ncbi:MAG TPA: glycosyltransferase [bacterium]|nr:glycosyltransferase [bacterium]